MKAWRKTLETWFGDRQITINDTLGDENSLEILNFNLSRMMERKTVLCNWSNMATEEITIRVDTETARAFNSTPAQERHKLEFLLNLKLKESLSKSDSLLEIMDEISQEALNKGLTPEILQSLLEDE